MTTCPDNALYIILDNSSDIISNPPDFFSDVHAASRELFRRYAYGAYNNHALKELRMISFKNVNGQYLPVGTWFISGSKLEEAVSELSPVELGNICAHTKRGLKPVSWTLENLVFSSE